MYGNSFESCLVAIVIPNKHTVENWATSVSISEDFNTLCANPKTKEYVLGELNRIGKDKKVLPVFSF